VAPHGKRALLIGVVLGSALLPLLPAAGTAQRAEVDRPAPPIVLATLSGDTVRLSQFRGHPLILKFWASWCPTCRTEMPELLAARSAHQAEGLAVITIDGDETPAKMRRALVRWQIDSALPVLVDHDRRAQVAYAIPLLPTTVFIDTAGIIRVIHAGAIRADELGAGLRAILSSHPQE
jgi:thiol-disulfide isomerase/thioredoxin